MEATQGYRARCPHLALVVLIGLCALGAQCGGTGVEDGGDNTPTPKLAANEVIWFDGNDCDWIELYLSGGNPVSLAGYQIQDENPDHVYTFPETASIDPGGFVRLDKVGCAGAGIYEYEFGLGNNDSVVLLDPDGQVVDRTDWTEEQVPRNQSWGRYPDGTGDFVLMRVPSPGAPNSAP